MNSKKAEDVKDMALKLDEIRSCCPEEYFYLKGWIHCNFWFAGNHVSERRVRGTEVNTNNF